MTAFRRVLRFTKSTVAAALFGGLLLSAGNARLAAQCPQEDFFFATQSEVDAAADLFADCTEFEHWLAFSFNEEDPINDLSAFSALERVQILQIRTFEHPEGTLSLEPLSGIISVDELHIDNTAEADNFPDFTPLTNLQGQICLIRFRDVAINFSSLSFPGITQLGWLEINRCSSTDGLPAFENLDHLGRLDLRSLHSITDLELPPSLISFGMRDDHCGVVMQNAGLRIADCTNVTSVTGEVQPERFGEVYLRGNLLLTDLDIGSIDSINGMLAITTPRFELFENFKDLRFCRYMDLNYTLNADYPPADTLMIRFGENSNELKIGSPFVSWAGINFNSFCPGHVEFTADIAPYIVGNIILTGNLTEGVTGLANVDSLRGRLEINMPSAANLPDLTGLSYVRRRVVIYPGQSITHLDEFGALRYVGQHLQLEDLPLLSDISGLSALDTVGGSLTLMHLPSLESPGTAFTNTLFLNELKVEHTALTEFPAFENLLEMSPSVFGDHPPLLTVRDNPDLTTMETMPLLETYASMTVFNNPMLSAFSISADAAYSGSLYFIGHPLFSDCAESGLCNAAAQASNYTVNANGDGCWLPQDFDDACALLNVDDHTSGDMEIYAEGDRRLHLCSSRPTGGEVHLFDVSGRLLAAHRLPASDHHILPLPQGSAGIILVRYNSDAGVYAEKIFR